MRPCDPLFLSPPILCPSTKLEGCTCARAQVHPSVFSSPSPLMALRERGTKGVRVPLLIRHSRGVGNPSLLNNHPQLRNAPRPFPFPLPPFPSTKTRGIGLRLGAGLCLCFFFPLSLEGPKGEGEEGGEGSPSRSQGTLPPRNRGVKFHP